MLDKGEKSFLKKVIPIGAFVGGLCCFAPIVLVLFGLSTVSFAASLADTFYGTYRWIFRGIGLLFLFASLFWYFYKVKNVCTINKFKRERNRIINFILITLILGVIVYILWLYVFVEIIGKVLGIW